jgi:lysophospholipase
VTAPLVDIPEAPVPDHGTADWFSGADGSRLRAALFLPAKSSLEGQARGSVVVNPGRSEPIEKYFEVVQELLDRGFVVLVHDWRGQGLSVRPLADRFKGHSRGVAEYLSDFKILLDAYEARLPKPWLVLGHSMGGCLTALALGHGEKRFAAALLSAPMLGLLTGGRPKPVVRLLTWTMMHTGKAEDYILGDPGNPHDNDFETNILTHDQARFDRFRAQVDANPDLKLGAGTWSWLNFALDASAWLKKDAGMTRIDIPVTVIGAGEERLVDNADQRAVTARIPNARYVAIPGAYHELLQETDDIRAQVWREFDALADEVAPQ